MFKTKKNKPYSESRLGQMITPKPKHILRNSLLILGSVGLILQISIGVQVIIQCSIIEDTQTWTSSLPSYWGGIVGGFISGSISFIGVFLTIRYYRNSDAAKNRIEHMPFIHIAVRQAQKTKTPDLIKAKIIEVPNRNYEIDRNNLMLMDLELENIGNGFANTLVIHLGNNFGGKAYQKLLKIGEKEQLQLKFNLDDAKHTSDIIFGLQYIDCMANEYAQIYTIKYNKHSITIENGYPQFLGQTHLISN